MDLQKEQEPLKVKDMIEVLKGNRPLQCYIISATSDKIAQVTASQAVIGTMLSGIIIGNMGIATILTVIGMRFRRFYLRSSAQNMPESTGNKGNDRDLDENLYRDLGSDVDFSLL